MAKTAAHCGPLPNSRAGALLPLTVTLVLAVAAPLPVVAQAKKLNPLANETVVDVSIERAGNSETLNVQPRVPIDVSGNWRLVARANIPLSRVTGAESAAGFSDIDVSAFVASATTSPWIWRIGPTVQMPTANGGIDSTGSGRRDRRESWCLSINGGPTASSSAICGRSPVRARALG